MNLIDQLGYNWHDSLDEIVIKPRRLEKGDKIAIVSLSWGGLGDAKLIHKYGIAKERLELDFGLNVVAMPHALKGSEFVYAHPQLRAKDLCLTTRRNR